MIIKKGTDVFEVVDTSGDYVFIVEADSEDGKKLNDALEEICGSPAIEASESKKDARENNTIMITRYFAEKDLELKEE